MRETRFKQTEYGLIPSDWIECSFADVLQTFTTGATPYRGIPENFKGNINWITSGELNYNTIYDTKEHISDEGRKNANLKMYPCGTFLMAITGLEAEGTRGRCAFIGTPSTTNQSCLAINSTDKMIVEYLFHFYCYWGDNLAFKYSQGTKQQSYTSNIVKSLPIYLPPSLVEQRRIAKALSDIDGLISSLDKLIEKKKNIKQGTMQQLLTGKKRLKGFNEPWVEMKLGSIGSWHKGQLFAKSDMVVFGSTPCIHYGELFTTYREVARTIESRTNMHMSCKSSFGDILFPASDVTPTGLGRCTALMKSGVLLGGDIIILRPRIQVCSEFLSYLVNLNKEQIINRVTGTTVKHITPKLLAEVDINMPSDKNEQTAIATILSDMDNEISSLEAKKAKYESIKKGMMQELLTGKIRLV